MLSHCALAHWGKAVLLVVPIVFSIKTKKKKSMFLFLYISLLFFSKINICWIELEFFLRNMFLYLVCLLLLLLNKCFWWQAFCSEEGFLLEKKMCHTQGTVLRVSMWESLKSSHMSRHGAFLPLCPVSSPLLGTGFCPYIRILSPTTSAGAHHVSPWFHSRKA